MQKEILATTIAIAIILSGCITPDMPPEPEKLEIEYSGGAMHLEWGSYQLKIDEESQATFTKKMGLAMEKTYEFKASKEEKIGIYKTALENNFFGLQDHYTDETIMDGGWDEISITADGETKTVTVTNYYLPQFDAVATKISQLIKSKLGEKAFTTEDMMDDCPAKEEECNGKETTECEEWKHFCDWKEGFQATAETCEKLENRKECVDHCYENDCKQELCDTLVFEAEGCIECGPGCCSKCKSLTACETTNGCKTTWVHPNGESWQYGGCENVDFCITEETLCEEILSAYQGYAYHSIIEENKETAMAFELMSQELQDMYNEEC